MGIAKNNWHTKAKELMMTSNEINGEELNKLGVLYKLTNAENMDTVFKDLIEKLNEQSFISICMVKQQIKDGLDLTFEKSIANETINQNSRFQHSDVIEGMNAFFEKRQPNYKNTLGAIYIVRDPRNVVTSFSNHNTKPISDTVELLCNDLATSNEKNEVEVYLGSWNFNYNSSLLFKHIH